MFIFIPLLIMHHKFINMKKVLLFLILIYSYSDVYSQSETKYTKNTILSIDFGLSGKEYLNFNFDAVNNRFLYGFQYEFIKNSKIIGEDYSITINWDQFPEDFVSSGKEITQIITFNFGYNIFDKFFLGCGIGIGEDINYKNMYDNYHILGYNGYYHMIRGGEIKPQFKVFAKYFIPISNRIYISLSTQQTTLTGFGGDIGLGFIY